MKSVFVVQHVHVFGPGEEDVKMIGVYRTKDSALAAVARLRIQPGFCDLPGVVEPGGDDWAGFYITEYTLDEDNWTEGYITV
jgi:homoserine kinase type II